MPNRLNWTGRRKWRETRELLTNWLYRHGESVSNDETNDDLSKRVAAIKRRPKMLATCLQVRRAYEAYYNLMMPDTMTYQAAACKMAQDMGETEIAVFIQAQSNDPSLPN